MQTNGGKAEEGNERDNFAQREDAPFLSLLAPRCAKVLSITSRKSKNGAKLCLVWSLQGGAELHSAPFHPFFLRFSCNHHFSKV